MPRRSSASQIYPPTDVPDSAGTRISGDIIWSRFSPLGLLGRCILQFPFAVYLVSLLGGTALAVALLLKYDLQLDTGISTFRARETMLGRRADALDGSVYRVLPARSSSSGRHSVSPKNNTATNSSATQPPRIEVIEDPQSTSKWWLTVMYESSPEPGVDLLNADTFAAMRAVEQLIVEVPGYKNMCLARKVINPVTGEATFPCKDVGGLLTIQSRIIDAVFAAMTGAEDLSGVPETMREWVVQELKVLAQEEQGVSSDSSEGSETDGSDGNGQSWQSQIYSMLGRQEKVDEMTARLLKRMPSNLLAKSIDGTGHSLSWFFDRDFSMTEVSSDDPSKQRRAVALRSGFAFAVPFDGYHSATDRFEEQTAIFKQMSSVYSELFLRTDKIRRAAPRLRVIHVGAEITQSEIVGIVLEDLAVVGIVCFVIILCLLLYTRSAWVTFHGAFGILISLPISMFLYRFLCGFTYVNILITIVPFLILGIGCDDVMVFIDAIRKDVSPLLLDGVDGIRTDDSDTTAHDDLVLSAVHSSKCFEICFLSAYETAGSSMFITSLTTCVAFMANLFSPIPALRMLGAFAGICVAVNFFFAITFLPASFVIRRHFLLLSQGCRSPKASSSCCACAICCDSPHDEVSGSFGNAHENMESEVPQGPCAVRTEHPGGVAGISDSVKSATSFVWITIASVPRLYESFLLGVLRKHSVLSIVTISVLLIFAITAVSLELELSDRAPTIFREDHYIQRASYLYNEIFYSLDWTEVNIVWGLSHGSDAEAIVDYDGMDVNDPFAYPMPEFERDFGFAEPVMQTHINAACSAVRSSVRTSAAENDGNVVNPLNLVLGALYSSKPCFMEEFHNWATYRNESVPVSREKMSRLFFEWLDDFSLTAKYSSNDARSTIRVGVIRGGIGENFHYDSKAAANALRSLVTTEQVIEGFDKYGTPARVVMVRLRFYVDIGKYTSPLTKIRDAKLAWDRVVQSINDARPSAAAPLAFHTSELWERIEMQNAIVVSATISPLLTAGVSLLAVAFMTYSIFVAVATTLTLAAAVIFMLATLVIAGWTFGVVEAMCISIMIGSSIDYILHVGLGYQENSMSTRDARIEAMVRGVGGTVTAAAMSTGLAMMALLACTIILFVKIGIVVVINTVVGLFLSLIFFGSLMALFGPAAREQYSSLDLSNQEGEDA